MRLQVYRVMPAVLAAISVTFWAAESDLPVFRQQGCYSVDFAEKHSSVLDEKQAEQGGGCYSIGYTHLLLVRNWKLTNPRLLVKDPRLPVPIAVRALDHVLQ